MRKIMTNKNEKNIVLLIYFLLYFAIALKHNYLKYVGKKA
jgi:hypothetical protein